MCVRVVCLCVCLVLFDRDPFHLDDYVKYSMLLSDLNNEGVVKNQMYRNNMMSLKNFVMEVCIVAAAKVSAC